MAALEMLAKCAAIGRDMRYRARQFFASAEQREITNPRVAFEQTQDQYWYWLVSRGWQVSPILRSVIPGLPVQTVQQNWTGSTGEATLREGFHFYCLVRELSQRYQCRIRPGTRVLDFGCGWGRIIRFFLRDVDYWNLFGCDCYAEALEAAREQDKWCDFRLIKPMPPSPFDSDSFDLIYLYSVFSHLSEEAHLSWLREFYRILNPGGLVFVTTRKRDFILQCEEFRHRTHLPDYALGGAASFLDAKGSLAKYDAGEFCHSPSGGGGVLEASFYGETCIPLGYIEREWSKMFRLLDFRDDEPRCPQAVVVIQKPGHRR
jgi:SAM-dependent methyltransferase